MFAVSGLIAIAGQLRITRWFAAHWRVSRSLVFGAAILAMAFVPLAMVPNAQRFGTGAAVAALLVSASLLAVASAALFPFEMRTVVVLAEDKLVATHYGFYSTIVGVGILVGNLAVGSLMSVAHRFGADELVWGGLILIGLAAVVGLYQLDRQATRAERLSRRHPPAQLCQQAARACLLNVNGVLADAVWVMRTHAISDDLWSLIVAVLPAGRRRGRPWNDHRRTLEGIIWRYRTGSPWCDLPEHFGPWQSVAERHLRWSVDGIYARIFAAIASDLDAEDADLGALLSVDSTSVRAHRHAAGARSGRRTGGSVELQEISR
ncbi:hypothetical protein MSHO_57770 [Mycobacterium shottsii]|uniref:Insertion element IS402-like domain-containing protein n=3 Tax=Mycobacterium shottsii TaxID=133549 RepID=A0A7I7LLR3_9MYCO|nr:hypothetical protein MSHO_57770 [Mycobacterium shottsii]